MIWLFLARRTCRFRKLTLFKVLPTALDQFKLRLTSRLIRVFNDLQSKPKKQLATEPFKLGELSSLCELENQLIVVCKLFAKSVQ